MKSLNILTMSLIKEVGALCDTDVERDLETVAARVDCEGESFLTITLPAFARAFERALELGDVSSVTFPGFRSRGGFPLFLGGLLKRVFCESSGLLLDDASVEAVQGVRQICLAHSKIFEVCDDRRTRKSVRDYVECEHELAEHWDSPSALQELQNVACEVFGRELSRINLSCRDGALVPRHGPGSTADRLAGNGKWDSLYWSRRLNESFPIEDYLLPGYSHFQRIQDVQLVEPGAETPVRVVAVPKTAAKARIIAMEPANVQYCQQALLREFASQFTHGHPYVDLGDQEANRRLAQQGSEDGSLATLDLSEASDRVTVDVVRAVFGNYPDLLAALMSSRSELAHVPGEGLTPQGQVIKLVKFASMGSATCFPVESIVFATIALAAVKRALNDPEAWRRALRTWLPRSLRVFGDDIIVPTRYVHEVLRGLALSGAKPNPHKSFWNGPFRESCGGDYFRGECVNVTRLRKRLPATRRDSSEVLGLIAFRNQLYMAGYWMTTKLVDDWLADLRVPMPVVDETSPVVGRVSVAFKWRPQRYDPSLQSPLIKGLCVRTVSPKSESSDLGKLLKCLIPGRVEPFADPEHLTRSGRPDAVRTYVGWGSPF